MNTFNTVHSNKTIDFIRKILTAEPSGIEAISELTDLSSERATEYMVHLKSLGLAHVDSYGIKTFPSGFTRRCKIYAWGPGEDAKSPKYVPALTPEAQERADQKEAEKERAAARRRASKVVIARDALVTAFFGPPAGQLQH
jgi:hypothetical protein